MGTCEPLGPSLDICPTQEQIIPQLLALLPRGRAFNTHDGPPPTTSIIYQFWNAFAEILAYVNQRICALRSEFFCATASKTLDTWLEEYGLPDGCDPFPNLCAKVGALGGVTCSYYQGLAAAIGWTITCGVQCATDAGMINAGMSCGQTLAPGIFPVVVHLAERDETIATNASSQTVGCIEAGMTVSCAPSAPGAPISEAGSILAGMPPDCLSQACLPEAGSDAGLSSFCCFDISSLDCLLSRVVHAHSTIQYFFV